MDGRGGEGDPQNARPDAFGKVGRQGSHCGDRADHWWWVYAFTGMNYPTLNIEYNYDIYLDNITAHVPPNWTSLQVAEYLYKNIAGDKKLYEALLNESKNSSDVELAQRGARSSRSTPKRPKKSRQR